MGQQVNALWHVEVVELALALASADNGQKNTKYPVSESSLGQKLLMAEIRGEWPNLFELIERKQ